MVFKGRVFCVEGIVVVLRNFVGFFVCFFGVGFNLEGYECEFFLIRVRCKF